LHEITPKNRLFLFMLLAFIAGAVFCGFFFYWKGPGATGELDRRYDFENRRAAEIIGRIEAELARERELNRELREHNNRARELADGIAGAAGQNVRNLQEAVGIVSEIRKSGGAGKEKLIFFAANNSLVFQ
jgi:hypothetical protein